MKTVFQNLKKTDWLLAAVCLAFIVVQVWLDLKTPDYMAEITTLVQTAGSTMGEILSAGGMMLLCSLGSLAASVVTAICAARIAATLGATLRGRLFSKVQSFSMEEIGRFSTASLITRSTNDVTQIQMLIVLGLQMLLRAPIMAVFAIYKIAGKQWEWTLATAVAVVVLLVVVGVCLLLATPKFRRMQKLTDDLNRVTRENLTGLRVVRAYNAEDYQETKFAQANAALTGNQLFAQRTLAFLLPSIQLVMSGLSLAIYWIGGVLIDQAGMQAKLTLFSDMMVFSQYAIQVVMAFMMLVMIFMILPRASVAAHRIGEVLHTHPTILDGTQASGDPARPGQVEFRNVSFRYPDAEEYVLKDISFTAKRGETVAIIGSTGCGKSTVVNLIPRFYDATEGQVLVDGVDVREYDQRSLRNKIGYVSQKATLFTGTIASNVAYGDNGEAPPSPADVQAAVATAQAEDFVSHMEGGYEGYVAQGGANLSGGQKQRLTIARALVRRPDILILDDSSSALDYATDAALRRAIRSGTRGMTVFMVSHRVSAVRQSALILVLDDGRLAGAGTHEELLDTCAAYQEICRSQERGTAQ